MTKRKSANGAVTRRPLSALSIVSIIRSMTPQQRYEAHVEGVILALFEHDWHAVADHAMDVRELIAAHPELRAFEHKVWSRR